MRRTHDGEASRERPALSVAADKTHLPRRRRQQRLPAQPLSQGSLQSRACTASGERLHALSSKRILSCETPELAAVSWVTEGM
jgi:hypothetical protein